MQNAPSAGYYYSPQPVPPPSYAAPPPMCYPPPGPTPGLYPGPPPVAYPPPTNDYSASFPVPAPVPPPPESTAYYTVPPPTVSSVPPYEASTQFTQASTAPCGFPPVAQYDVPPPPGDDNGTSDDTARLQEEFIRKCKYASRPATPPPFRRQRSRSRSTGRDARIRSRKSISPPTFRSRSRSYRRSRSRSRESRHCFKERSLSSSASDEYNHSQTYRRKELLDRWRLNNCSSSNEMSVQLEEISKMKPEDIIEKEKHFWTRTAPADLYYVRCEDKPKVSKGTEKLMNLCEKFEYELVKRAARAKEGKPLYNVPSRRSKLHHHKCCRTNSDSESEPEAGEFLVDDEEEGLMEELERKKAHPDRLHPELWYNDPGEMNDGPLCRCSAKAKRSGIRHNIYAGELNLEKCDVLTNNADRLHHYRITVSPPTNFLIKTPTIIEHDNHEYIFEGFSMLSHKPLENLPVCKVIRFNIEYTILYIEEKLPEHFIIKELDLFYTYLFKEILELVDLDFKAAGDASGCSQFHFMPRFVRELPENGKELLSMNEVLNHLLSSSKPLISIDNLKEIVTLSNFKWQNYVDDVKGMVVTFPGRKPCSLRVDQLDRDQRDMKPGEFKVPEIVHFGIRPPQLSYAGNPEYQKAWRDYVKFRHLLANMPKASFEDKRKLESKENKLLEMRTQSKMKRDVTIAICAQGFYRTGIMCDIVQHAMLIPVLVSHLRFHRSLDVLENDIGYTFKNRCLLQLALTHPSYRENFGTNPDHARNSLTNCSIRQPEYGDRRIHYLNTRKRGINTLINIMSRFGKKHETESNITHNERLEFLGDAVVEFVTSIHLFHLFPRLEEGGLATYRAAIVQNQHLAVLAKKLGLDGYMLYAHGSDLCHDLELRHAMANCFEALMGALFLDGNIEAADKVFGETLFQESAVHLKVWVDYPPHPLQEQEPGGDRQWISKFQILQDLTKFEDSIGLKFTHIRLLARAFTDRSIGYTNLTLGSNQRLEFLGDTVLQLIASDYLYKYFPEHHEGHLSLLRSSLVNNRTQAVVCDDLGMASYAIYSNPKAELKTKDRADLLEAFLGALYIDKGLIHCETFCNVCFFPRLHDFIMHQDWNDPKSKLQQCCLTLRTMEGGEPEIPIYKVIECMGPTNTRLYTVAVYFKAKRLAQATGHSIQQAEMNAAKEALDNSQKLFPQLDHQKRVIAKSIKQDPPYDRERDDKRNLSKRSESKERRNPRDREDLRPSDLGWSQRREGSVRSSSSRMTCERNPHSPRRADKSGDEKRIRERGTPSERRSPRRKDRENDEYNIKMAHRPMKRESQHSSGSDSDDTVDGSRKGREHPKVRPHQTDKDYDNGSKVLTGIKDDKSPTKRDEIRCIKVNSGYSHDHSGRMGTKLKLIGRQGEDIDSNQTKMAHRPTKCESRYSNSSDSDDTAEGSQKGREYLEVHSHQTDKDRDNNPKALTQRKNDKSPKKREEIRSLEVNSGHSHDHGGEMGTELKLTGSQGVESDGNKTKMAHRPKKNESQYPNDRDSNDTVDRSRKGREHFEVRSHQTDKDRDNNPKALTQRKNDTSPKKREEIRSIVFNANAPKGSDKRHSHDHSRKMGTELKPTGRQGFNETTKGQLIDRTASSSYSSTKGTNNPKDHHGDGIHSISGKVSMREVVPTQKQIESSNCRSIQSEKENRRIPGSSRQPEDDSEEMERLGKRRRLSSLSDERKSKNPRYKAYFEHDDRTNSPIPGMHRSDNFWPEENHGRPTVQEPPKPCLQTKKTKEKKRHIRRGTPSDEGEIFSTSSSSSSPNRNDESSQDSLPSSGVIGATT